jgi:hypothetical protein
MKNKLNHHLQSEYLSLTTRMPDHTLQSSIQDEASGRRHTIWLDIPDGDWVAAAVQSSLRHRHFLAVLARERERVQAK